MRRFLAAAFLLWASSANAGIPASVSQTPPARDQANAVVTGTITSNAACSNTAATAGCSSPFLVWGTFNIAIYGSSGPNGSWTATVEIDRSFDGGTTWIVAGVGGSGAQAIYSTPNQDVSVVVTEPEQGMLYRVRATAYTSGTINYRVSTTSSGGVSWHP